ncbi:A24 family peptidase [Vulcanisaeta distributa]|uniref:Peptidase A24A prepilin type IV n=1 Tax=Vulcanisaeta distributa (strain DSM 14429 / JCM 11212 / NBRC 100878 / IC-017) TaxID=572478 RepID=E1QUU6_VULDI|nr:A24 family peptidase [Vulcanisaeta distributa]ADN49949.1 peptidase A24A prepilin type IV [Vulcanisaeta distributa DSM 14429]
MVNIYVLLMVDYLLVLAVQVAASIQDLRTREISDWTWIIGSIMCVPLGLYVVIMLNQLILYIVSVVVGSVFALAVYWLRAMGGADSKSIAFISASIPTLPMATPALTIINITPLSILINSLIIALVLYIPYNVIQNIRYGSNCEALARVKGLNRLIYLLTLMCVPVHKVLRNPNNYAISQVLTEDGFQPIIRLGLDVDDPRELLIEWLSKGKISIGTPVLTSYHIPFIVPITLGLVVYVLTHVNVLTLILAAL